ncbi:MAG: Ig-like domain-containing protein [Atribacterota bacterium]|nr:Ig-like domain-containing protein [Atribacterota bacterium]
MKRNKDKIFLFTIVTLLTAFLTFSFTGCVPPVPEVIEVTGVSITEEDHSIEVGDALQLTTLVTPEDADNKAVTWESDNADVAAVDENGLVTALKKGVANITVITEDGAFTDTIKITVTKPYVPSPPTIKKYEVDFQVIDAIPVGINSRNGISIDLSGFKIEIFTDAERLNKKTDTLTDVEGKASVTLPNGEYWFRVSKEGYADYPPEAPLSLQRQTQPAYFKVEGADVTDIPPIPMQKTYILTMVVDPTGSGTASDDTNTGPYTAGTEVTISAEAAGGYKFDSWSATVGIFADNTSADTTFTMPDSNATVTANFAPTYTVTVDSVEGGTATVVANPNSAVLEGDTVTVTISNIEEGKAFSSIAVEGDDTTNSITATEVTAGEEYTFTMPAEDVTVTVTIETSCTPPEVVPGYFNSSSDAGSNTSSVSVPLHPNSNIGDLVIIIFATEGDMGTVTPQDGFQEIITKTGSGYPGIAAFYNILTETENNDFTCTLENQNEWLAQSYKITGHRNTDPIGNSNDGMINNNFVLQVPGINGASCSLLIAAAVNNEVEFWFSEMECIGKHSDDSMKLYFEISKENRENASYTGARFFNLWDDDYSGDISGIMFEILSPNSEYQAGA